MPDHKCFHLKEIIACGDFQKLESFLKGCTAQDEEIIRAGLMDAATQGLSGQVEVLVRYEPDPETLTRSFQQTLRFAILRGTPGDRLTETLRVLVRAGADSRQPLFKPVAGLTSVADCLSLLKITAAELSA